MQNNIIDIQVVENKLAEAGISDLEHASIRDVVKVANLLEKASSIQFIRMEMGVPGLPPAQIGTEAEINALKIGVAQYYPMLEGYPELSEEAARFVKNFMDIDINPAHIIPTVGAMQASYTAFMALTECKSGKDTVLFIDPGFPVQKTQLDVIGKPYITFDIYEHRGKKLRAKLEEYLKKGTSVQSFTATPITRPGFVSRKKNYRLSENYPNNTIPSSWKISLISPWISGRIFHIRDRLLSSRRLPNTRTITSS